MNQISGKIKTVYIHFKQENYLIRHIGRRKQPGRGVRLFPLRIYIFFIGYSNYTKINPSILYTPIKSMFNYPQIETQKRRDFYVDFKYRFHRGEFHINGNTEIPFEFFVQPPLPCFKDTHPVQDNNISFQQSLWGDL